VRFLHGELEYRAKKEPEWLELIKSGGNYSPSFPDDREIYEKDPDFLNKMNPQPM